MTDRDLERLRDKIVDAAIDEVDSDRANSAFRRHPTADSGYRGSELGRAVDAYRAALVRPPP